MLLHTASPPSVRATATSWVMQSSDPPACNALRSKPTTAARKSAETLAGVARDRDAVPELAAHDAHAREIGGERVAESQLHGR